MHVEFTLNAVDDMCFDLADVVRDVVQHREFRLRKMLPEHRACQVSNNLAVRERAIHAGAHCTEIALPEVRLDRGAGQLPVGQRQAEVACGEQHLAQVIRANLVPEPARSAVDADDEEIRFEPVSGCDFLVEDLRDTLHLEVVIA